MKLIVKLHSNIWLSVNRLKYDFWFLDAWRVVFICIGFVIGWYMSLDILVKLIIRVGFGRRWDEMTVLGILAENKEIGNDGDNGD